MGRFIISFMLVFIGAFAVDSLASPTIAPGINISSEQLSEDYEANELAADKMYKDCVIIINGVAISIGSDYDGTPNVLLRGTDPFSSVSAKFMSYEGDKLIAIKKGERVSAKCIGDGMNVNAQLKNCVLIPPN